MQGFFVNMKQLLVYLALGLLFLQPNYAQQKSARIEIHPPLDIPLYMSGTFAELRSNHFHAGVDLRTQTVEGHNVRAIDDGYVSRIVVSPTGYGKAIYITHPATGLMSVYGHLQQFNKEIGEYVKGRQYAQKSFKVNLFPEAGMLKVNKGDLIGLSGNTGSSGGPHLHFEIRDGRTQETLNPLKFGLKIKDFVRPNIFRLAVYPEDESARISAKNTPLILPVEGWGEQHRVNENQPISAWGELSFGISTHDTHNDTPNKNGVYSIEMLVDEVKVFSYTANRFAFDESRYINSMIDYGFFIRNKSRIIRTKIDPFNKLRMYGDMESKGSFVVDEERTYKAEFIVTDYHGNISKLPFTIQGKRPEFMEGALVLSEKPNSVIAGRAHAIQSDNYAFNLPADALYKDEVISHNTKADRRFLTDLACIGSDEIPLHKAMRLEIPLPETTIPNSKLLAVRISRDNKPIAAGGKQEGRQLVVSTTNFGCFAIAADTIAPTIRAKNVLNGTISAELRRISFEIDDNLSGIDSYVGELNGQWVLMEYDPKTKSLFYEIDERLKSGENSFKLIVTDKQANRNVFTKTYTKL